MAEDKLLNELTAVLIDDEIGALEVLASLLERVGNVKILAQEQNSNLGLRHIMIHKPDVVFLDVEMATKNGITLLKEINELSVDTHVVFVSGYDDYTFEAFKNGATDYLVKPVPFNDLQQTLIRISQQLQATADSAEQPPVEHEVAQSSQESVIIQVKLSHGKVQLDTNDILYLNAAGSYTEIYLRSGEKEVCTKGLWLFSRELPDSFFKIHRSTVVNIDAVTSVDESSRICVVSDGDVVYELSVSKARLDELQASIRP